MIKKSVFEDELISGMQRELRTHDQKQGFANLDKAVDYLNSAVQILEDSGMTAKADSVLRILAKIATRHDSNVKEMPSIKTLMDNGVTMEDLKNAGKGDAFSKARINTAFRRLGFTDKEISHLIGHHNLMGEKEAAELLSSDRSFGKIKDWLNDPTMPVDPSNPQPGETISFNSLPRPTSPGDTISFTSLPSSKKQSLPPGEDLVFKSIAEDRHTKGLTPEKMLANLKHHGLMTNLADDGADQNNIDIEQPKFFDEDYRKWKRMQEEKNPKKKKVVVMDDIPIYVDDDSADDLLNADIDHDPLEVSENDLDKTFEDTD